MEEKVTNIGGRLHSVAKGNIVAGANEIFDDDITEKQNVINTNTYRKWEVYNKEEVNNIVSRTPETDVIVIDIPAASQSDIAGWLDANTPSGTDPETGKSVRANKLYRVPGPTNQTYSEWAWDGTKYTMLANKDYGVDNEPIEGSDNFVKSGGIAKNIHELKQNAVGRTMMEPVYIMDGKFMIPGNSNYLRDNVNFEVWKFKVEPNKLYFYSGVFSEGIQIYYMIIRDEDDYYLSGVNYIEHATTVKDTAFSTPAGAKFVYLNVEKTNKQTFFMFEYSGENDVQYADMLSLKSYGLFLDNYWTHYFFDSRGLVPIDSMSVFRFRVMPNRTYKFSGRFPAGINTAFICFADDNGNFISYADYYGSSDIDVEYSNQSVTTPSNCSYVCFNVHMENVAKAKFEIFDISSIDMSLLDNTTWDDEPTPGSRTLTYSGGIEKEIHLLKQEINDLSLMEPAEEPTDGYFMLHDGPHANPNFKYYKYAIDPNKLYYFSGRYHNDVDIRFVYVYSDTNEYIDSFGLPDTTSGVTYSDEGFKSPANSAYAYLNVAKAYEDAFCFAKDADGRMNELKEMIVSNSFGVDIVEVYKNCYYDNLGTNFHAFKNFAVVKFRVDSNRTYLLSNIFRAGTDIGMLFYTDLADRYLAYGGIIGSSSEDVIIDRKQITTPANAIYAYLNVYIGNDDWKSVMFTPLNENDVLSPVISPVCKVLTPYETRDGYFTIYTEERENPNFSIWRFEVQPNRVYKLNGLYVDVSVPMIYLLDSDRVYITHYEVGVAGGIKTDDGWSFVTPPKTKYIYMNAVIVEPFAHTFSLVEDGTDDDRTAEIEYALGKYDKVTLLPGFYKVNGINMPLHSTLEGAGMSTIVQSGKNAFAVRLSKCCHVSDIYFVGALAEEPIETTPITGVSHEGQCIGALASSVYGPVDDPAMQYYVFPVESGGTYHVIVPPYTKEGGTYYPICFGSEISDGRIPNCVYNGYSSLTIGFEGDLVVPEGRTCLYISVSNVVPTVTHITGFEITEPSDVNTISIGNYHGALILGSGSASDVESNKITRCDFRNFSGGAITCENTGYDANDGLIVSDCHIQNCGAGINITYLSEFNRFTNVMAHHCSYGTIVNGGNNNFVNCDFSGNGIGVYFNGGSGKAVLYNGNSATAINTAHGLMSGCTINHSGFRGNDNPGYAIAYLNSVGGFLFTGIQLHYGKMRFINSESVQMCNVKFGYNVLLEAYSGMLLVISNVTFNGLPGNPMYFKANICSDTSLTTRDTNYLSDGNLKKVRLINAYNYNGDQVTVSSINNG